MSVQIDESSNSQSSSADGIREALGSGRSESRISISDINQQFGSHGRPLGRHSTGEVVLGYVEALRKLYTLPGQDAPFDIIPLDSQLYHTNCSSVLVVGSSDDSKKAATVAYVLLIEETVGRLPPKQINTPDRGTVEVPRTTGDVYDAFYEGRVREALKNVIGSEDFNVAGVSVINNELTKDSRELRDIAFYAQEAIYTALMSLTDKTPAPFSIAKIDLKDSRLSARLDFSAVAVENAGGLPNRSDITVTLVGSSTYGQQAGNERIQDIARINAYIDLTYIPTPAMNMQQDFRNYQPVAVITDWDTATSVTPEIMLLGLATATLLNDDLTWANTFRPNLSIKGADLRDIGAIGYDINLSNKPNAKPTKIDVKAESFQHKDLVDLIITTMHPTLTFAIDLEETGELSWLTNAFIEAGSGDMAANDAIIQAANALTDGNFRECFRNALSTHEGLPEQVIFLDGHRIPLGYYLDTDGKKRDVRDIDMLAVLNLQGKNEHVIQKWSDVFDDASIDPNVRSAMHLELINSILSSPFEHKGWAQRGVFNPAFIEGLSAAVRKCGLVITPANTIKNFNSRPQRGNANIINYAMSSLSSGLFRGQTSDRNNYRGTGHTPTRTFW